MSKLRPPYPDLPDAPTGGGTGITLGKLFLPYFVFTLFNLGTYLVFLYGPFDWPVTNERLMTGLLVAFLVFYTLGYVFGAQRQLGRPAREVSGWIARHLSLVLPAAIAVFAASIYVYTGENFWNTARIFGNQQQNYYDTLRFGETSSRLLNVPFGFLKMFLQPIITLAVLYATINFRRLTSWQRLTLLGVYLFWLLFSVFRGTDKEIFDISVILLTAAGVTYFGSRQTNISLMQILRSLTFITVIMLLLVGFLSVFSQRKLSRMGGNTAICVTEVGVCARPQGSLEYVYALTAGYATHGYYGMSLALQEDFTTTLPFGNAPALKPLSDLVAGPGYLERSYTNKIDRRGWDNGLRWSTTYTSWASDISFWLVPFVMFFLGLITALAWKDAVQTGSLLGAAVFSFMVTMSLFLSANNQVGIALDSLVAFQILTLSWLVTRKSKVVWRHRVG